MAEESDGQDDEEKTEEASSHKLEKAKEEGQVVFSKELVTLGLLIGSAACLLFIIPWSIRMFSRDLIVFIDHPDQFNLSVESSKNIFLSIAKTMFILIIPTLIMLLVSLLTSGLYQKWGAFRLKPLTPSFSNLSLKKGFKKIFSTQNLVENIKNWIKLTFLIVAIYLSINQEKIHIPKWIWISSLDFFNLIYNFNFKIYTTMIVVFGFIAILDYLFQRYEFMKKMRMSQYDLKQEYKETEGNPEVKAKIRQIRASKLQQRMMDKIPNATVILANPTHFAVALQWDETTMNAPTVVAKGQDLIAQKIKEIAKNNDIPIIENPSLTRALYDVVEIEQEIPPQFYKAVAEIIRLVMRLKNRYFK
jgi:flagellar biosynthetic protein FlhB